MNQIPAPIGMEPLVDAVQQCCLRAQQYHPARAFHPDTG